MKINKKTYTSNQIYAAISTAIFLIIIYLPLSNEFLNFSEKQEVSKRENRQLATKPKLDISKLDPYPSLFDKYFGDHFIFRDKLLQYHTHLNFFIFKQSPVPEKVAIGKDSWLFFTDKEKDVYEGKFNLSDEQISIIVNELKQRDSVYKKSGIAFVILIAPTKAEIYSDYLPKYIQRAEQTVTELIIEKIRKETDISVIYPKQTLMQKRNEFHTYHQFDNHWNQAGAFVAYQYLMNEISERFPYIQTNTLDKGNVILKNELTKGGNLANMIGLDNVLKEQNIFFEIKNKKATEAEKRNYTPTPGFAYPSEYEMVYKTSLTNLSKALIIRDSYTGALIPYLSESFGQSCFIFDAWQYGRNAEIIENEKPDIIILEIFEPHISNILDNL
jgi:hypothetical protein